MKERLYFNRLRELGIPVELIAHPRHPENAHLVCKNTLIITEIDSVCYTDGQWVIGPDSSVWGPGVAIEDAIAEVMDDVFDDRPGYEPEHAVILIHRTGVAPEDLDRAAGTPTFLLHGEDDEIEALRKFCTMTDILGMPPVGGADRPGGRSLH